ncbi:MAG: DUF951 domain-containing protein [Acetobacterium sp.]|nr:DUF951 domain-containing protein [Acetobacterium sp.]
METKVYALGDRVEMKKKHPCGSLQWEIIRVGADIKIKCLGCGHIVMLQRSKFNKQIKKILSNEIKGEV